MRTVLNAFWTQFKLWTSRAYLFDTTASKKVRAFRIFNFLAINYTIGKVIFLALSYTISAGTPTTVSEETTDSAIAVYEEALKCSSSVEARVAGMVDALDGKAIQDASSTVDGTLIIKAFFAEANERVPLNKVAYNNAAVLAACYQIGAIVDRIVYKYNLDV